MSDKLVSRLEQLRSEFQAGQSRLHELELQQTRLRETMLRISGAIQVLEEMIEPPKTDEALPAERAGSNAS